MHKCKRNYSLQKKLFVSVFGTKIFLMIIYHSIIEKSQIPKVNTIQTIVTGQSAIEQEINNLF